MRIAGRFERKTVEMEQRDWGSAPLAGSWFVGRSHETAADCGGGGGDGERASNQRVGQARPGQVSRSKPEE